MVFITSCKGSSSKPSGSSQAPPTYVEFFHIIEEVDPQTEAIVYTPLRQKLTCQERDSLMVILDEHLIEFKITDDSTLLVRADSANIGNYHQMAIYDNILRSKVKTDLPSWKYK